MSNKSNWMRSPWIRRQQVKVHPKTCDCKWCAEQYAKRLNWWAKWAQRGIVIGLALTIVLEVTRWLVFWLS